MNLRTDLALERHEIVENENIDGVSVTKFDDGGIAVTRIDIETAKAAKALEKPIGAYITVDIEPLTKFDDPLSHSREVITKQIREILPCGDAPVLVAGLGNKAITADALGPLTAEMIFATRHITREIRKSFKLEHIKNVAAIVPGVLGKTGIESAEIIAAVAEKVHPRAVIAVDALAARRIERLGTTVQISTSGLSPGSGVGNSRSRIDEKTLGVPVISIGIPTVVDAATLASDLFDNAGYRQEGETLEQVLKPLGEAITVTPKEIDLLTERGARLLSLAINCALQPEIDAAELMRV